MKKIVLASLILVSSVFSAEHVIDQSGKSFAPVALKVKVGDTIKFKNSDPYAHNAYTDDEANEFDTGMQAPGTDKVVEIKGKGKFNIECAIHPNMLLEVEAE